MEDASVEEERGPDAVELVGNVAQSERQEAAHVVHARHLVGDGVSIVPGQEGGGWRTASGRGVIRKQGKKNL